MAYSYRRRVIQPRDARSANLLFNLLEQPSDTLFDSFSPLVEFGFVRRRRLGLVVGMVLGLGGPVDLAVYIVWARCWLLGLPILILGVPSNRRGLRSCRCQIVGILWLHML